MKNLKIFDWLKINILEKFKHNGNRTLRVVLVVFDFFKILILKFYGRL